MIGYNAGPVSLELHFCNPESNGYIDQVIEMSLWPIISLTVFKSAPARIRFEQQACLRSWKMEILDLGFLLGGFPCALESLDGRSIQMTENPVGYYVHPAPFPRVKEMISPGQ